MTQEVSLKGPDKQNTGILSWFLLNLTVHVQESLSKLPTLFGPQTKMVGMNQCVVNGCKLT